ncbi:MAG TPA: hypothetical protein V6C65_10860 [Allocoleopsis sp.]
MRLILQGMNEGWSKQKGKQAELQPPTHHALTDVISPYRVHTFFGFNSKTAKIAEKKSLSSGFFYPPRFYPPKFYPPRL